jgi:sugar phosphate isomerase/epimerase
MTRRTLLQSTAALAGASLLPAQSPPPKLRLCIFSKHLQFLEGEALAKATKELGFDGIDLAVRAKGHIEPARVRQDLPPLVALIRKHGLEVPMLTTDISDADTPYADDILATMTDLGIHHYRWGGYKWTKDLPLAKQIENFKPRVAKLAALNAKYQASAMYHTHSGIDLVGASIWDLHEILQGFDPKLVGVNYDIGHATVEGGFGGWRQRLLLGEECQGSVAGRMEAHWNRHGEVRPLLRHAP